jgi:hypothetical protein
MMNFNDLKELTSARVNTVSNGRAFREITTAEVKDALLGETIEYMSTKLLADDASLSNKVAFKMTQKAENDCDGAEDIGKLITSRILNVAERLQGARSKDDGPGLANAQGAANGICLFIQRLQNGCSRNSFYRHLDALRYEAVSGDMVTKSDYDGFQYVNIAPNQIEEVIDELYDELTVAYGYAVGLCEEYIAKKKSTFPFCSIPDGANGFNEYYTRVDLYKALTDNKAKTAAVDNEALALI